MDSLQKAQIIVEFAERYSTSYEFDDFFIYNDLGVPMAVSYSNDLIELKKGGINVIDETYAGLCELFDADENEEYQDLQDLMGQ